MSKIQILLRNIGYNFLAQFWFLTLSFFTTPYIVKTLGTDSYGLYSIIGVVMGYFSFLDLGLGNAIIKYLAEFYGKKDYEKMGKIIGTSLVVYGLIGFVGALILSFGTGFLVNSVLKIPTDLLSTAYFAFYVSAIGFLINMPLAIYGNIPNALSRMDITNIRNIFIGSINIFGIVGLLYYGYGLRQIVVLNVALSIVGIVIYVVVSKKLLPQVSFKPSFDRGMFKKLMSFGIFKFFNQMSGQIIFHLDRLLIAFFLPISWVAYYAVPLTLAQKAMSLVFNVAGAFFPTASELSGKDDKTPFYNLYSRSMKLVSILVIPLFTMLFLFADKILSYWIGGDFAEKSELSLQLLSLAYLIQSFTTIPSLAAESFGKPNVTAFWSLVAAGLNLALCFILIPKYGINGAAAAIFINSLLVSPVSVFHINKTVINYSNRRLFFEAMSKAFIVVIFAIPVFILLENTLVKNLVTLMIAVALGELTYLMIGLKIGLIDARDKQIVGEFINKVRKK